MKTFRNAPENYDCPFCKIAKGKEEDGLYTKQSDVFYHDDYLTAFVASHGWPNNPGHALVISNKHFENLYDLPDDLNAKVNIFAKKLALAFKEVYRCDGVSTRQHNEKAGGQDVWHYHLHVFPRYTGDNLYQLTDKREFSDPKVRAEYAAKLRKYFAKK